MKKALQLLVSMLLLAGFMTAGIAVAQETEPQDVTIRDLNTYDNLESIDQIEEHPLAGELVRFTAIVVSHPRSSGLATYTPPDPAENETVGSISRIHVFVTDTTALADPSGRDGMSMQVVQGSGTTAYSSVEGLNRGDVITVTGELTFFEGVAQFVISEIETTLGNVEVQIDNLERFTPLLDPIEVSPADFHTLTGPNEVALDFDAYQKYQGAYVRISNGIMANYGGSQIDGTNVVERPSYTINKDGAFVANRDIGLRYRNDTADEQAGYKQGFNFIRVEEDGYFERPPLGSAVNISGFLVIDGFTDGFSYSTGAGLNISPMEDGVLWNYNPVTEESTRLENGVSDGGTFTWPDDLEFIAAPPQVVDVSLSPASTGGSYLPSQTVTVTAIVAPPEDDPTVTVDSVIVNYSTASLGTERLVMTNTGGNNYSVELPGLVAFEAPSLFVQAYGSNDLVGRGPLTGTVNFFVDGGTITSIETIQRTGDDLEGSSPIAGVEGLDFDITATVVSTASDGIISVQDGTGPWSGIFLGLASNTAGLERGDVINITGGTAREAEIEFNAGLSYTYLEDVELEVISSSSDIAAVVPDLTTNEFNEPAAPGEAWEGMLVTFENVQMIRDEGFGEVSFASLIEGSEDIQEEIVYIDWGTNSAAIGTNTGFPQDFNRHAILGNNLDRVTGLVIFTFGASKIIPRELSDIEGDNYTVPRPLFNLTSPGPDVEVAVVEGSDITATWQSFNPRDYDGNTVTFEWVLFGADSTEIVSVTSDNDGSAASVTLDYNTVDGLLESLGLQDGESVDVLWSVRASDGSNAVLKSNFLEGTGGGDSRNAGETFFETTYNALTLFRGEVTSNEELGGLPRTYDLEQNYPNPFNPTTTINYAVPEQSEVRIEIYNVIGRRVATLVDREMAPGNYTVNFDASSLSSGMYFYRLKAGSTLLTKKMTLIK